MKKDEKNLLLERKVAVKIAIADTCFMSDTKRKIQKFGKRWGIISKNGKLSKWKEKLGPEFTKDFRKLVSELPELSRQDVIEYLVTQDNGLLLKKLAKLPYAELKTSEDGKKELWVRIWGDTTLQDIKDTWMFIRMAQREYEEHLILSGGINPPSLKNKSGVRKFQETLMWLYLKEKKRYSYGKIGNETANYISGITDEMVRKAITRLKKRMQKSPRFNETVNLVIDSMDYKWGAKNLVEIVKEYYKDNSSK